MKSLVSGLLAVAALATVATAFAQRAEYPERNITVIVPFPPGGASDITARLVTSKLTERLKQTVVIDNRAGANGGLGAVAMKQAAPDGYTLLVGSIGVFAINPVLYKNLRYDPQKDFDLLVAGGAHPERAGGEPVVSGQHRWRADRAPEEESRQGHLRVVGHRLVRPSHRRAVLAEDRHVRHPRALQGRRSCHQRPDRRPRQCLVPEPRRDLAAREGREAQALAVTSDGRVATLPDVPAMAQAGVKDLVVYSWQSAAAPKGLPAAVKAKLEAELVASANAPDIKAKFEAIGFDVVASNGGEFAKFLADEIARWKAVVETGNITAE